MAAVGFVATQANEARVELRHVLRQEFLRVACRIERGKQDLHAGRVVTKQLQGFVHRHQRRRTDIRHRIAEEEDDDLAL